MSNLVQTGVTLQGGSGVALGLNAAFKSTYDLRMEYWKPVIDLLVDEVPSTMELESYFYSESRPYPARWPAGATRPTKGFKRVRYTAVNKDWSVGVSWNENQAADDVTKSLMPDIRETASRWATLKMRCLSQIVGGQTDADLLDSLPNAPDGSDTFHATDGAGGNRFGVSGGNIITGTGVANESQIAKDFYAAQTRFMSFLDTENQPLIDPGAFSSGFVIMYPPALNEMMKRAFVNATHITTTAATGALAGTGSIVAATATPNTMQQAGDNITLFPNPWLTGDANDWFVFLKSPTVKPFFWQDRQGLQERILTSDTGDRHAVTTKEASIYWDKRGTMGVNATFSAIQVSVS